MKTRLGIFFGGKTAEHEVSIQSAKSIIKAVDKNKYEIVPVAIDKTGDWYIIDENFVNEDIPIDEIKLKVNREDQIAIIPHKGSNNIIKLHNNTSLGKLDVAFSIIHGTLGEDGSLQGYFNTINLPFVGCDVLGSAIGMDKDVAKRLLLEAGIPIAKFKTIHKNEDINIQLLETELGWPMFVKPANTGSSVGVMKAIDNNQLKQAIENAFNYDSKIIVEEFIQGREIECSVLGNNDILASAPGEIIAQHDFYSYKAKYVDENGAILKIPAELDNNTIDRIKNLAVKTFKTLCGKGMARIDLFLTSDNQLVINEINTLPGFTSISMYAKLIELSGIPYSNLIERLVDLALEDHKTKQTVLKNLDFKTI